jgi:hypothetical protein
MQTLWYNIVMINISLEKKKKIVAIIVIVVIFIVIIFLAVPRKTSSKKSTAVGNFEECQKAGYLVMESHPAQCLTADGQLFTEEVKK